MFCYGTIHFFFFQSSVLQHAADEVGVGCWFSFSWRSQATAQNNSKLKKIRSWDFY